MFRVEDNYRVLLFMISKQTEILGAFLETDFYITYFKTEIQSEERNPEDEKMRSESENAVATANHA